MLSIVAIHRRRWFVGAILFACALNFKQIALYYALGFFFGLLSISIHTSGGSGSDFISSGSSTGTGSTATSAGGMSSAGIERRRKPLAVGQAHVVPLV